MSLATFLIHVCTIQRITQTITDPYGASKDTWADLATDVPCRLIEQRDSLVSDERHAETFFAEYKLIVDASVDLREQDRVVVSLDDMDKTFAITEILVRSGRSQAHHKTARLSVAE